mgnify:CR=1 FL=1
MKKYEIVKVLNVSKKYNGTIAVDNVSFSVFEGEVFSLLGPNGAGKTSLLNIIVGVLKPTSGKVLIRDVSIERLPLKAKKLIGFLPQENPVYEYLTGEENLMLYAGLYGMPKSEARRRCRELLEMLGLMDASKKLVSKYSGGMKRKLSLAISLINDPEIVILDEPTTGLDPHARREFWSYINTLRRDKTVILSTHYMEEADTLSDRVAIMDRGRILVIDDPEVLKKNLGPYSPIEVELKFNVDENVVKLLEDLAEGGITYHENVCRLLVKEPEVKIPQVMDRLYKNNIKVSRIIVSEPTLEDVFIRLTGRRLEG